MLFNVMLNTSRGSMTMRLLSKPPFSFAFCKSE